MEVASQHWTDWTDWTDWMDGWDWLSYTAVTPRASLQSDANNKTAICDFDFRTPIFM